LVKAYTVNARNREYGSDLKALTNIKDDVTPITWLAIKRSLRDKQFLASFYRDFIYEEKEREQKASKSVSEITDIHNTRGLVESLSSQEFDRVWKNLSPKTKAQRVVGFLSALKSAEAMKYYLEKRIKDNNPLGEKYKIRTKNEYLENITGQDVGLGGLNDEEKKLFYKRMPEILINNSNLEERLRKYFILTERNLRLKGRKKRHEIARKRYLLGHVFTVSTDVGKVLDKINAEINKVDGERKQLAAVEKKKLDKLRKYLKILKKKGLKLKKNRNESINIRERNMNLKKTEIMRITELANLVREVMTESAGGSYSAYPYNSYMGQEDEPREDFMQDWRQVETDISKDQTRGKAIELAQILVKDLELFGDVLELIGKDQSLGVEILDKIHNSRKEPKDDNMESEEDLDLDLS